MIKPPLLTISILGLISVAPLTVLAQSSRVQGSAEREIIRRESNVTAAKKALVEGDKAMDSRNYDVAVSEYKLACDLLHEAPATHDMRAHAVSAFSEASVKLAEQRIVEGRIEDARATAKLVLDDRYNPGYTPAIRLLRNLEDPDYYNKTVGPKFYASIEEVKRLMVEADGLYQTGRYDLAYKRCEQVLNIDKYNIAARKMEEKIDLAKDRYEDASYNNTRAHMTWQLDHEWDRPVRKYQGRDIVRVETNSTNIRGTEYIQTKLNKIIIPKIEFRDATVREAVDFLKQKSKELDTQEENPSRRGVNIVLKLESTPGLSIAPAAAAAVSAPAVPGLPADPGAAAAPAPATPAAPSIAPSEARITLSLSNIPLAEALRYITNLAGLKVKIDPYAVTIVPLSEPTDTLITKEYKVPPSFLTNTPGAAGPSGLNAPVARSGAGASAPATNSNLLTVRQDAKTVLTNAGVEFPPGASANYIPASSRLIVRNTESNLDLVDQVVDTLNNSVPMQVSIETKFVEIQQTNFKELSFDWLFRAGLNPGSRLGFTGGNTAIGNAFPFTNALGTAFGGGEITTGLRSGSQAITGNAIDTLLAGGSTTGIASPATFAISGVFSNETFQVLLRALNQKRGVDLLSAPSVTTKSGQRAVIEIIREFRYPTEFTPPVVPQSLNLTAGALPVITPTTPTAFETRNTGVTLEVEPVVGPDGQTIDLNLVPQVVEFEGFVNYGSPIYGNTGSIIPGVPGTTVLLTANTINQPIFSTRKVTTSVSVWDGQTVVIGGLMREDVQKVEDKVPGIGDLPLIGRMFRSSVDQHIKRNLVIFVSARLMNPAGENVHEEEEKEEEVPLTAQPDLLPPPSFPQAPLPK